MIFLIYILKMVACSGLLYAYYFLFLRNRKFHHYNRFFLLAAMVLSLLLPLITIPVLFESNDPAPEIIFKTMNVISTEKWEDESINGINQTGFTTLFWKNSVYIIYITGIFLFMYFFIKSLLYLFALSKKYPFQCLHDIKLYNTSEAGTPFSFFKKIFWNREIDLSSRQGQQIFRHELFHVGQKHSSDILFTELVTVFFWINPFFHLIRRELKAIHEFLADQYAASGDNHYAYAELLVLQTIELKKPSLSNYFFQNHIKRRIAMITTFNRPKYGYLARIMALPLGIFLFIAVSVKAQFSTVNLSGGNSSSPIPVKFNLKPLKVLIDAGHGGSDAGAHSIDGKTLEKDLTLMISRKIKELSGEYNIDVVMSRETDIYPPIKDRPLLAAQSNADILLSIHVNAPDKEDPSVNSTNGFEILITKKNEKILNDSKILGTILAQQLGMIHSTNNNILQRNTGIWILDQSPCPAALIECGYITNEKDLAFITKGENQEKIARKILEGLVRYNELKDKTTSAGEIETNTSKELTEIRPIIKEEKKPVRPLTDSILKQVTRHYLKTMRYPEIAQKSNGKGEVYFSVLPTVRGDLIDIIFYNGIDQLKDEKIQEIVIVGYETNLDNQQKLPAEKVNQVLRKEIIAATDKAVNLNVTPGESKRMYYKLTFKLERKEIAAKEKPTEITSRQLQDKKEYPKTFTKVEIEPKFPGGTEAWQNYLLKNFSYPQEAQDSLISGTVKLRFVVDEKGNVNNITALNDPGAGLAKEAIRLIENSGKWLPAIQNGHLVTAYKTQNITFRMEEN